MCPSDRKDLSLCHASLLKIFRKSFSSFFLSLFPYLFTVLRLGNCFFSQWLPGLRFRHCFFCSFRTNNGGRLRWHNGTAKEIKRQYAGWKEWKSTGMIRSDEGSIERSGATKVDSRFDGFLTSVMKVECSNKGCKSRFATGECSVSSFVNIRLQWHVNLTRFHSYFSIFRVFHAFRE